MSVDDHGVTDSSPDYDRNGEENCSTEMVGVLLSLQSSLKQLIQASKAQTEAFNHLREDILLQPDPNEEDKDVVTDGTPKGRDSRKQIVIFKNVTTVLILKTCFDVANIIISYIKFEKKTVGLYNN